MNKRGDNVGLADGIAWENQYEKFDKQVDNIKEIVDQYTYCNTCVKSDVCLYKNDCCDTIKNINNFLIEKTSGYITADIRCKYYRGIVPGIR